MPVIGVVADDLTGATTTGVLLARSGSKTTVFFHTEAAEKLNDEIHSESLLISTSSRPLPKHEAYKTVQKATALLDKLGVQYFSKRIDTTMRGGVGVEIDAMLDILPEDTIAVVVPAMPQSRRILVGGYSVIDGVALIKTPVSQDVRTPVKEGFIPALLAAQTRHHVGQVTLNDVMHGIYEIKIALMEQIRLGNRVIVVDAITLEDVSNIAHACLLLENRILAVDPGPFTAALGFHRGIIHKEEANIPKNGDSCAEGKTVLVVAGSATPVTKLQMDVLCRDERNVCVSVDPLLMIEGGEIADKEAKRVVKRVKDYLSDKVPPRAVLLETALHGPLLNLNEEDEKRNYISGESAERINAGLGMIVADIFDAVGAERFAGIYATGGDTMVNVCNQLGVAAIEMIDYVIPQADIGRLVGKFDNKMPIVGKGGLTGDEYTACKIVDRLFLEACRDENN
ncbi:four-carbon acid sugar kinase family protein [Bisgaard Taxon 10/6]|uniref:Four-carbon acid sugar kinase family protein n=1 Tax=Exercitatus varius TaxID=67857 RepID=A0ABT6ET66_9PAST|nr:four-carbon acid sugar kinase family protein [Exercitatus varius]MDG2938642.1 four-carbon acid sugar kinase family protein [Exercitatus varius]MDG2946156.1 four-carbon acid sugar kinase family protein [Exercitatus varius]MDG2957661.1 four-carbon acid sugar kinase family protein [Exercitatus varius]QOF68765.1 four-carbon acid sugar kinase family protein [Actinobacillus sp. GY-402]